jgi:GNAT superfamily N-acetyltransferase
MVEILLDLSPATLTAAIEENLSAWIPVFGRLGRELVNDPPGVKRAITDIPLALFNSIMDARLAPGDVDAAIQAIIADASARKVPVLWWTGPSTRPVDLDQYLIKFGFTPDDEGPGMAVELAKLNESLPQPAGLSVQLAQDDASWREWSRAMGLGFEAPAPAIDFFANAWQGFLRQADPETVLAYTGWLNGKAVSTSLLFLGGGVAGIYAVATIPEARWRGIGAWLTLYPLLYARTRGYKAGILQSSEMGLHVYRSIGFQEYCRITSYRWKPKMSE